MPKCKKRNEQGRSSDSVPLAQDPLFFPLNSRLRCRDKPCAAHSFSGLHASKNGFAFFLAHLAADQQAIGALRRGCEPMRMRHAAYASPLPRAGASKQKEAHDVCLFLFGDPYGNRTHVFAVRGRCLSRLTNGPFASVIIS